MTAVLLAAVWLAACGGGNDKQDAEQTVRDFVKATNERDADKLCNDLLSKDFIEQTTGATGDKAKSTCKQQLKLLRPTKRKLTKIVKVKVDGDKATVSTILETQDQPQPQTFSLKKVDGRWRLAGGAGG
ncbi:MAG TPA: nuclear transport factor 2 family protein [Thermoleophilaceae bacterium]